MSQAGIISVAGSIPSIVESLTPDSGAPVPGSSGTINTLGYKAGTVPTIETYNDGVGNFRIADQSWHTQYVVDASSTPGLKGTFQTIQAAINQAVTDGMTYLNEKVIYVRVGTYTENLIIAGGTILVGETLSVPTGGIISPHYSTVIIGNHVFSGNCVCGFNNIIFEQTVSGDIFNGGSAAVVLGFSNNCYIVNSGSGQILNNMPSSSSFNFSNCTFNGGAEATQFTGTGMTSMFLAECTFGNICDINFDTGAFLYMRNCTGITSTTGPGTVTLGAGSSLVAMDCRFVTGNSYCVTGSGFTSVELKNCNFNGATTAALNTSTATWLLYNCSCSSSVDTPMFTTASNVSIKQQIQGNILSLTKTAVTLNVTTSMYYIGVTSTASARTINLPDGTGTGGVLPTPGQEFLIKDESGAASTHNITVTTQGGTITIDGATSQLINLNYGSMTVVFDGSNYFII